MQSKKTISDLPGIHLLGRSTFTGTSLNLFWAGSGIEFLFTGSRLSMVCEGDYDTFEPWISVLVDDQLLLRMPAARGQQEVSILRGMDGSRPYRIRIIKDQQAMTEDKSHRLTLHALCFEGKIEPPPYKRRIEFIGDSITSGEGFIGSREETAWACALFTIVPTYAMLTAAQLEADYRIISQSGWGISCGWNNDPACNLPSIYEAVCASSSGTTQDGQPLHGEKPYDFSSWPADAVIINLGTNDEGSFHQGPFTCPQTGRVYQHRMTADGKYDEASVREILEAQKAFLRMIRRNNPHALLIWCYGMAGTGLSCQLETGVREYCEETGDKRARYLELPEMNGETIGSRHHPGSGCHAQAAKRLSEFILKEEDALV